MAAGFEVAEAFVVVSDSLSSEDGVVSGSLSVTASLSVSLELSDEVTEDSSVVSELTGVSLEKVVIDGSGEALHEA